MNSIKSEINLILNYDYNNLKVPEAKEIQNELRSKLKLRPLNKSINVIAGADISFNRFGSDFYAGIVLISFPDMIPIGRALAKTQVTFPYIPGYLAFRELPAIIKAWNQLPIFPDIIIFDGHGIAHPRRMGIAAHFGALTGYPSIGCAKKKLFGTFITPRTEINASSMLYDGEEIIGGVLRTKTNVKPVFVSPGNNIDVESSLQLIKKCVGKYRIPEPTRLAHEMVNAFRRGEIEEGYQSL